MNEPDEFQIDFGDDTLNDPNYEANVDAQQPPQGGADDVTTETAPTDGAPQEDTPQPQPQQGGAQAGTGTQGDAAAQGQQRQQDANAGDARQRVDAKGNLIDKDGKVIAAAGAERRHFEKVQQQTKHIDNLERELQQLRDGAGNSQVLNGAPEKLGLNMQEAEIGLQAIASFKKDPVSTARWMLQETMRMGYNLHQIVGSDAQGQINGGSMDLQAIRAMIAETVQPLIGDREVQQQSVQHEREAQREYDAFIAKHDLASVHEDTIANMMKADRNLSPEVAYWQLREYSAKHGFDFSKPLRAQVQARQQQGAAPNGHAQPQQNAQSPQPMPNGGAPTRDMQNGSNMANPDDAWDVIVKQSLAEAGLLN